MATVNPYLHFDGNCHEAFEFYRSVFGGEFRALSRFKDMPAGVPMHEKDKNEPELILHVSLPLGGGTVLMGSDRPPSMGPGTTGNNFNISIHTGSEAEAKKIFDGLSAGGRVTMPLQKTFWASHFGMLTDQFGVQWMVNGDNPQER